VQRTVTLNAPVSGYVTGKEVFEGTRVMPGMDLLTVTDLSSVWIEADLYEYEAQAVRVGQTARSRRWPIGGKLRRVAFIYPNSHPNPHRSRCASSSQSRSTLKPQMYANVASTAQRDRVIVPDSALIETGGPRDRVRGSVPAASSRAR